jgi:hypothetical protein
MNEGLAQHVHTLATRLRYRLVNRPGGPPGVAGPLSEGAPWDATAGYLAGANATLEQALTQLTSLSKADFSSVHSRYLPGRICKLHFPSLLAVVSTVSGKRKRAYMERLRDLAAVAWRRQ